LKLAAETRMYLQDVPPALELKLQLLQQRDLIIRTVLALSSGVQKIAFWDLWHKTAEREEVTTFHGKLLLMSYEGEKLSKVLPLGRAYQSMAAELRGVESIDRIPVPADSFAFRVARRDRTAVCVVWSGNELFSGTVNSARCWGARSESQPSLLSPRLRNRRPQ
jgi:hypothetical protein